MLCKLCTDFYKNEDISCAKDILYTLVDKMGASRSTRRKITHRGDVRGKRNMEDILNILLELPLHTIPVFVCKDLANLPPLSMNNFDMASVMKNLETLQLRVDALTDIQNKCIDAQVTLCTHLTPSG